jgi:mycofactocin precursor
MSKEPQASLNTAGQEPSGNDAAVEQEQDLLQTEEVIVEEMAIDGICGVY